MGNLGRALVNSTNFLGGVASLSALYDSDPEIIGTSIAGVTVSDIAGGIAAVPMAVICTPPDVAQEVANRLVAAGAHALLNFAPVVISVPLGVAVRYVDFSIELQILAYQLTNGTGPLGGGVLHTLGITPPVRRPGS
jgi:redox-sensing transcriptional repressor